MNNQIKFKGTNFLKDFSGLIPSLNDDDVYLEYYSGKGFHINYSCLHVLRKTHKLVQLGISNEQKMKAFMQQLNRKQEMSAMQHIGC
jgi:hypothetical protein